MIRFIIACLSIGLFLSCNDSSILEDFSSRAVITSVISDPDTLVFDSNSSENESISFQLQATLSENLQNYSPQVQVERNDEIISTPNGIFFFQSEDSFEIEVTLNVDTRSNAPLLLTTYIMYGNGESSDFFLNRIVIESNLGSPPIIDSVAFPSEITKPESGATPVVFNAYVRDDDGLENIELVTMSLFDDQNNAVGSPLQLYDDGSQTDLGNGMLSGDLIANDGNFTRTLQIENSNTARTLILRFLARDRTGQESNEIESTFTILEP